MREGEIPGRPLHWRYSVPPEILASLNAQRDAAVADALLQETKATPIDDAAWEQELERGRHIDAGLGHPPYDS
jgi:hypothetical protein